MCVRPLVPRHRLCSGFKFFFFFATLVSALLLSWRSFLFSFFFFHSRPVPSRTSLLCRVRKANNEKKKHKKTHVSRGVRFAVVESSPNVDYSLPRRRTKTNGHWRIALSFFFRFRFVFHQCLRVRFFTICCFFLFILFFFYMCFVAFLATAHTHTHI